MTAIPPSDQAPQQAALPQSVQSPYQPPQSVYHPAPAAPPYQSSTPTGQSSGMAVASMVLGIVSIPTCCAYGIPSLVCGILAVVFAGKANQAIRAGTMPRSAEGMVKAGKICGTIGIVLSVLAFLGVIAYFVFIISMIQTGNF